MDQRAHFDGKLRIERAKARLIRGSIQVLAKCECLKTGGPSLLMIMAAELAGPSRGTMTGLLSGSGFLSYAIVASLGGFLVAQVGYGALSVVLAVATAASGLWCLFLKHSQAER